jgi:hypothetical protein
MTGLLLFFNNIQSDQHLKQVENIEKIETYQQMWRFVLKCGNYLFIFALH